jgi:hypothetical protein
MFRKLLLNCGILSSLLYVAMYVFVAMQWEGYSSASHGPRIAANLPTPWVGVWERINIGAFLLWVVVLAVALLRGQVERPQDGLGGGCHPG